MYVYIRTQGTISSAVMAFTGTAAAAYLYDDTGPTLAGSGETQPTGQLFNRRLLVQSKSSWEDKHFPAQSWHLASSAVVRVRLLTR